ncbi:MAG: hypothetical protein ACETWM_08370 [Candidatus Lokiarchaeia archaeon]
MKIKKLVALTMVTLLALMLVPLASSGAASNQWTPILPQQVNTQPKAIPTEPLGDYISDGEYLIYDAIMLMMICFPLPDYMYESGTLNFTFEYDDTRWADWFIVNMDGMYFAIHNTTREIGLNGTELFDSLPADDSVITRLTGVYSPLAIPTGIKAGDKIKTMIMIEVFLQQCTLEVLGRITTPMIGPVMGEFYDTWLLHGTWKNASMSLALQTGFDTESGLLISSMTGGSFIETMDSIPILMGISVAMIFNSTASSGSPVPLTNTRIEHIETAEEYLLPYTTFTYDESGYWYTDWSAFTNGSVGKATMNSVDESYMNFTLEPINSYFFMPIGISQTAQIPDSLWNYYGTWNTDYYNSSTRTGHLEDLLDWFAIMDFYRWLEPMSPAIPSNTMFMAPPWIRDGSVFTALAFLPLFWPDNSTPSSFPGGGMGRLMLWMPFRVSGAVPVVIDGKVYDCWRTELVVPTDLSDLNITQLRYDAYYERTSGILIKAQADIEAKMPADEDWIPIGYHKTWTLANSSPMIIPIPMSIKALPTPEEMSSYYNTYSMVFGGNSLDTLDPSLFNGGSVTANFSNEQYVTMWTTTQIAGNSSIDGKPIVKFMNVEIAPDAVIFYTATVNFYYTPSELRAMGARESGFTVYAWNNTAMAWELLNTTWDAEGRVVSADAEHFSVFALVASELTIFDILGPGGMLFLLNYLGQVANPLGGLMLPLVGLGIVLLIIAIIAAVILKKPK